MNDNAITVRMTESQKEAFKDFCEAMGESYSVVTRGIVTEWLMDKMNISLGDFKRLDMEYQELSEKVPSLEGVIREKKLERDKARDNYQKYLVTYNQFKGVFHAE